MRTQRDGLALIGFMQPDRFGHPVATPAPIGVLDVTEIVPATLAAAPSPSLYALGNCMPATMGRPLPLGFEVSRRKSFPVTLCGSTMRPFGNDGD